MAHLYINYFVGLHMDTSNFLSFDMAVIRLLRVLFDKGMALRLLKCLSPGIILVMASADGIIIISSMLLSFFLLSYYLANKERCFCKFLISLLEVN